MAKPPKKRTVQRTRHPFTQLVLECTCEPDAWHELQKEYKKFLRESQKFKKPLKRQDIEVIRRSMRKAYHFLDPSQWRAIGSCDPKEINHWVAQEYRANPHRRPTFKAATRGSMPLLVGEWPTHQK